MTNYEQLFNLVSST